jgi:16S rRNA (cytosine1402-N4)-methyltransferase
MTDYHIPVLANDTIELLNIKPEGVYADLTFGGGGHSRLILDRLGVRGHLYSLDQDADAARNAIADDRFTFVAGNFKFMRGLLRDRGVEHLDGVLADLGVSSHHFDTPQRGFSFRFDERLDMRMNMDGELSAHKLLNTYSAEDLTRVLGEWGEISTPYKVANCIVRHRETGRLDTSGDLIEAVKPCTPAADANKFLSKLFQAIRIEVNGEMEALKMALEQSLKMLNPGGRLVVISYHSLEDRLVKSFMRDGGFNGTDKDFFGRVQTPFKLITRKAMIPSAQEMQDNPRSRSAKLRAAEKIEL